MGSFYSIFNKLFNSFFDSKTQKIIEKIILISAGLGFGIHLLLIFLNKQKMTIQIFAYSGTEYSIFQN